MEIFIENQLKNIGYSIILGLIFGALYDIIRIIHIIVGVSSYSGEKTMKTGRLPRLFFFTADLIYMAAVTVMLSVFLYEFADGDLRMYLLLAAAAGFTVYYNTAGKLVMAVSETIVKGIRTVFRIVIVRPTVFVLRLLKMTAEWLFRHTVGYAAEKLMTLMKMHRLECVKKKLAREIRLD